MTIDVSTKLNELKGLQTAAAVEEDVIDLRELWHVVLEHRRSIIAISFISLVLATLVAFSMKPVYQSSATLLIETGEKKVVSIEQVYSEAQQSREYLKTQYEVIKSKSLARKVIEKLNLTGHPYFVSNQAAADDQGLLDRLSSQLLPQSISVWLSAQNNSAQATTDAGITLGEISGGELLLRKVEKQFLSMMTVSPVKNTQLVQISFQATDKKLAALLANQVAQMYIQDQLNARLDMTNQANSWLSDRLGEIREKLRLSEDQLQDYRERENILQADGVPGLLSKQLEVLNQQLISAQQRLDGLRAAREQIAGIESVAYSDYLSIPAVLDDGLVSQLIKTASDRQQRLDALSQRYGPKHPEIIAASAELSTAESALNRHVMSVVNGIEHQYQLANSSATSIKQSLADTSQEMQIINRKQHQLGLLQREVEANRQMYKLFLNRIKETTEARDLNKSNARVVDEAIAALSPVKPKKKLIILVGAVLGLGFGIFLAFLFEFLNNTLKTAVDLEQRLSLPALGVLPITHHQLDELWHKVKVEPNSVYAEGIRSIRTGVVLSSLDTPHKSIMVTSSVPNEGKTNVACNTAINLSEMNRVLLIDGDLRKPTISKLFGLPRKANGLAELLAGSADQASCIHRWGDSELFILPSGAIPPNPLELILSNAFKSLLDDLAQEFTHLVIDTPPVSLVSDASYISTLTSGVIFVVQADATPVPVVNEALKQLHQSKARLLGGVLNQFDVQKHPRYGEYGNYAYSDSYYSENYGRG